MKIDTGELSKFLVRAKKETYAGDGKELEPQRPGFRELEYKEGDWEYRDSYSGFYFAPGQEVVRFKGEPVWTMAYSGGMLKEHHGDFEFTKNTFNVLKKALMLVKEERPFRGPLNLKEGDYEYKDESKGDITNFKGEEIILFKGKIVFRQYYIGGLIIPKQWEETET